MFVFCSIFKRRRTTTLDVKHTIQYIFYLLLFNFTCCLRWGREVEGGLAVGSFVTTGRGVVDIVVVVCGWVIGAVVGASIKICYFG